MEKTMKKQIANCRACNETIGKSLFYQHISTNTILNVGAVESYLEFTYASHPL